VRGERRGEGERALESERVEKNERESGIGEENVRGNDKEK